jgi:HEAT repeat protein
MAKADPLRDALERLSQARRDPGAPASQTEIKAALKSKYNQVVARAATIAGEAGLFGLTPDMEEAFGRLLIDPLKNDKTCVAKIALVEAVARFGSGGDAILLRAVRHFQPEPAYCGPIDTAVEMRSMAAIALAERHHPQALDAATELLADSEPNARIGALKALAALPSDGAKSLLKYKMLVRDREPEVIAENLKALLVVEPGAMRFGVELMMDADERLASMAALSVGESKAGGAFGALREAYERRPERDFRANVLLAMALLRDERCLDLFCDAAGGGDRDAAVKCAGCGAAIRRQCRIP